MLEDRIKNHLLPSVMLLSLFQLFFLNCVKIMNIKYWWQQQQEQQLKRDIQTQSMLQKERSNKISLLLLYFLFTFFSQGFYCHYCPLNLLLSLLFSTKGCGGL